MTIDTYYLDAKGRTTIDKDPGATLDYLFDWTDWLGAATLEHATAVCTGVTLVGEPLVAGAVVTVWASGGTTGLPASITCVVTDSAGRVEPMTIKLVITAKVK